MENKQIYMIACVSKDNGIGKDGELLWHISKDMQFFRQITSHNIVVMGGNTFASIGRALPNRRNIVLSRREIDADGIEVFHDQKSLDEFLEQQTEPIFIIGGAALYNIYINKAEKLYLTEVNAEKPADTFFPTFDKQIYKQEILQSGEFEGVNYRIVEYTRKDKK